MGQSQGLADEIIDLPTDSGNTLKGRVLDESFFDKPAPMVAWDILGKVLLHDSPRGLVAGKIVETEAYLGRKDPACHASAGDTNRNKIFQSQPGTVYVFCSFGIYNCVNVLTSGEQPAGCVLFRAVEPILGVKIMKRNRDVKQLVELTSGPGKLADAFGISRALNGHMITRSPLMIIDCGFNSFTPAIGPRIGISRAREYPFRYFVPKNPYVSR